MEEWKIFLFGFIIGYAFCFLCFYLSHWLNKKPKAKDTKIL